MSRFKRDDLVRVRRVPIATQKVFGGVLEHLNQSGVGKVINVVDSRTGIGVHVQWGDHLYAYVEDDLMIIEGTTTVTKLRVDDRVVPGLRWNQDDRYRHTYRSYYLHGRILDIVGSTERAMVTVLWECGDSHTYFANELQLETDLVYSKVISGPDTLSTSPPQGLDKSLFQVQTIYLNQTT